MVDLAIAFLLRWGGVVAVTLGAAAICVFIWRADTSGWFKDTGTTSCSSTSGVAITTTGAVPVFGTTCTTTLYTPTVGR